jgi:hypothetical protein
MMGYNTAVMFCNDGLGQLKAGPLAGQKLYEGILTAERGADSRGYGNSISIGNHGNMASALPSVHADASQLVIVGGNTIQKVADLYRLNEWSAETLLQALAEDLGYNLSKKAWRKRKDLLAESVRLSA